MIGSKQTFQLAEPSIEGCKSCGSSLLDCQCIKFDAEATRHGFSMDDLAQQAPLSAFSLYGQPNSPATHGAPDSSGQATQAIATIATDNSSNSTMASGPSGSMF